MIYINCYVFSRKHILGLCSRRGQTSPKCSRRNPFLTSFKLFSKNDIETGLDVQFCLNELNHNFQLKDTYLGPASFEIISLFEQISWAKTYPRQLLFSLDLQIDAAIYVF